MKEIDERRAKSMEQSKARYDRNTTPLPNIAIGNHVAIQNGEANRFDIYGVVVAIDRFRKYTTKTASGRLLVCHRKFIRRRVPASFLLPDYEKYNNAVVDSKIEENLRPCKTRTKPLRLKEDNQWP